MSRATLSAAILAITSTSAYAQTHRVPLILSASVAQPMASPSSPSPGQHPRLGLPPSTNPPSNPVLRDEAWAAYQAAIIESVVGQGPRARDLLIQIRESYPGHPAARLAVELLHHLAGTNSDFQVAPAKKPARDRYGSLQPSGSARAELAVFQTIAGISAGGLLCGFMQCERAEIWGAVLAVGGGTALAGSLIGTSAEGITPGRALAINLGTTWGLWNGIAVGTAADPPDRFIIGTMLLGQLLGLAGGVAASLLQNPTAGDVAMANTTGMWVGASWLALQGLTGFSLTDTGSKVILSTAIVSDIGLVAGALLTHYDVLRMSRSRAMVLDAGGVIGTLLGGVAGFGLSIFVSGEADFNPGLYGSALVGMGAGVATAFYLTRDWDEPDLPDVTLGISPLQDGGMALSMGGRF